MSTASLAAGQHELELGEIPRRPALPSGTAIKLLRKIVYCAEKIDEKTGKPFGGVAQKARIFGAWLGGICERHVFRLLAALEEYGFIERRPNPGKETTIFPLVRKWQIPGRESHRPQVIGQRTKPMLDEVPQTREPVPVDPAGWSKSPDSSMENTPAMSGVLARVKSSSSTIEKLGNGGQQQRVRSKNGENATTTAPLPAEAAPVVALMQKCGIHEGSIPGYLRAVGLEIWRDVSAYGIWRREQGKPTEPGWIIGVARGMKASGWKLPATYLRHLGEIERAQERERARANRVQGSSKAKGMDARKPIPSDWFLGLPEEECRQACRDAVNYFIYDCGIKKFSTDTVEFRDRARLCWQSRHPGATLPWAETGGNA